MKKYFFTVTGIFAFVNLFSQNVGIGTTTPAARLHIVNNTDELVRLQGAQPYLSFYNGGSPIGYVQAYGADILLGTFNGNPTGAIRFYNNNIENLRIMANGNVGIGTSAPGAPLSFQNLLGNKISFWRSGPQNDFGIGINSGVMQFYTAGMDKIAFGWGNSNPGSFNETITMYTGNGFLGLGTTTPQVKLHVNTNGEALRLSGSGPYLSFYTGNTYKGYLWNKEPNDIELGTASANTGGNLNLRVHGIDGLTVQSDGRVRVGALACNISAYSGPPIFSVMGGLGIRRFDAQSTGEWAIVYFADNDLNFFYNGGVKAFVSNVNGAWISSSDQRLKENFEHYRFVLDGLKKLDVQTYHYKDDKTRTRSFGLVAQNLQQYFPELVWGNDKDQNKYLGIDYGKTGVLAIKAIQEQQEIIETQQMKIETLEKRLAVLESKQN
jgi:hypothetical protein